MKIFNTIHGMVFFLISLILCGGLYIYAVYSVLHAAQNHAVIDKKNANQVISSEYAKHVLSVGRSSQEIRDQVGAYFYTEEKLSEIFLVLEDIAKATHTKIDIQAIQSMPDGDATHRAVVDTTGSLQLPSSETKTARSKILGAVILNLSIIGAESAVYDAALLLEKAPFVSKINEFHVGRNQQGGDGLVARIAFSVSLLKSSKK